MIWVLSSVNLRWVDFRCNPHARNPINTPAKKPSGNRNSSKPTSYIIEPSTTLSDGRSRPVLGLELQKADHQPINQGFPGGLDDIVVYPDRAP